MRPLSLVVRRWSLAVALPLILGACSGTPSGTPPCSVASIVDVMAALENVSGYTFIASGTSLNPTFESAIGPGPYEYQSPSPRIELRGAYRAPDRSRLEVVAGGDAHPPLHVPVIFFYEADAIVVVGDRTWLLSPGVINEGLETELGQANLLLNLLRGAPDAGEVQWASPRGCSFGGQQRQDRGLSGSLSISVQVEVGPGALPRKIVEEWRFDQPGQPRKAYSLIYQPDFDHAPDIAAPGP